MPRSDRMRMLDRVQAAIVAGGEVSQADAVALYAEVNFARAALARVKALHEAMPIYAIDPVNGTWTYDDEDGDREQIAVLCRECSHDDVIAAAEDGEWSEDLSGVDWPCATIRAVAADEQEAGR